MESDASVGIGSIAHILGSVFKNIYEDEKAERDAFAANGLADSVALEHTIKHEDLTKMEAFDKARIDLKKARIVSTAKSPTVTVQNSESGSETCLTGIF